jgi:two-component system, sensor histidine kinase and response regulator
MFSPAPTDRRARILLVDDTPANIDVLVGLLGDTYDLRVANRGVKALRILDAEPGIDLILLDIMMPEMDGYAVCEEIRRRPETRHLPVIFLTARTEVDDLVRGFELGANDYLTKPFRPAELRARVQTHLMLRQQQLELERRKADLEAMVHIVSHDVANKFAVLRLSLDLLARHGGALPDKFIERLNLAVDSGIGLTRLVRQLRATEDKGLPLTPVDLRAAVDETVQLVSDRAKAKEIAIDVDVPALAVLAEPWTFRNSVLENLLTNAVKFSPRGSRIEVRGATAGAFVVLRIRDHGVGMPAEALRDLFDVAKSHSRPGTEGERGTGFGMPLVHRCVATYGGTVSVTSREAGPGVDDPGTEFELRLPVSAAPSA